MILTPEQQAILDGAKGDTMAKVMKTMVMYGDAFEAEKLVPITSKNNHLVTSFGLKVMSPVYDLMQQLLDSGVMSGQKFSVDPRPIDKNVPANFLQNLVFDKLMYTKQDFYENQLKKLGLMNDDAFTCTCYMDEVGNKPQKGEVLSWAESSAVVYANSVLGARCNRNSGIIDIMGSIVGYVPCFGLLTDEGRKADWVVKIETAKKPEAQLLGSAIGMKVMEDVPYIVGLDKWLGTELDDAELERVYKEYPFVWKNTEAKPKLCFMGCPHMSLEQLKSWTDRVETSLKESGNKKVVIPTVFTAAPKVLEQFNKTEYAARLKATGVITSYICPLMYMNNPLCKSMPVITSSNKLRTYTTARYYTDDEILAAITKGGNK